MFFAHVTGSGDRLHQHIPFPLDVLGAKYEYLFMKLLGILSETDWLYRYRATRWFIDKLANRIIIPVIHGEVVTPDEIEALLFQLEKEGHPISIGICECRHGENRYTDEMVEGIDPNYTCVMIGDWGKGHLYSYPSYYKPISAAELSKITRFWHQRGRVLNAWGISIGHGFVISYCHCQPEYCVPLRHQFKRGDVVFKPGYHYATVEAEKCVGPENCEYNCTTRCWFNAIVKHDGKAEINTALCQGCGQCFEYCPNDAAKAVRKENFQLAYCSDDLLHPEARN